VESQQRWPEAPTLALAAGRQNEEVLGAITEADENNGDE